MYHCLVFAVNDQGGSINKRLANHFPYICTFIIKTCDVRYSPTVVPPFSFRNTSKIAYTSSSMPPFSTPRVETTRSRSTRF